MKQKQKQNQIDLKEPIWRLQDELIKEIIHTETEEDREKCVKVT